MIYVQYILASVAVIQFFMILHLFGRMEVHRKLHMRAAQAGVKLSIAMMAMSLKINELQEKVGINGNQQQSSTDHQEQHSPASEHSSERAASTGANRSS